MSGYKVSIDDRESLTLRRHVSVDWRYLEALYRLRSKREGLGEPGEPWGREITDSIEDRLRELLEMCVGKEYGMTWNDYSIYGLQYIWSPSSHRKSHVLQSETIRVRISKIWPSQIHTAASLHANVYNVTGLLMAIAKITCIPVRRLKSDINGAPALTTPAVQTAVKVTHATVKVPGPTNELQDGGGKRIRSSPASSFTEILDPRGASKLGRFTWQLDATGMMSHHQLTQRVISM